MSTRAPATLPSTATTECSYERCEATFSEGEGAYGHSKYCSRECRYGDVAHGLLQDIKFDHRFCASCYRQIREVYPPGRRLNSRHVFADGPDDPAGEMSQIPEWAIGYAVPLPGTQRGLSEQLRPRDPTADDWESIPDDEEHVRMICECGAGHHQTVNRPLPKDELKGCAKRLSGTLDALLAEDKHEWHHDRETLLDEVDRLKSYPDGRVPDQEIITNALAEAIMQSKPYK